MVEITLFEVKLKIENCNYMNLNYKIIYNK
jgi:hypothetical protein